MELKFLVSWRQSLYGELPKRFTNSPNQIISIWLGSCRNLLITWLQSNLKDWGKITFIFCSALQLFNEIIYSLLLFITLGDFLWANMLISSLYLAWFSFFCSISTRRKDFKDSTKSNSWRTRHLGLTSKRKFTLLKISMMSLHISIKLTIWECCSQKTSQINWNNQNPRSFLLGFF